VRVGPKALKTVLPDVQASCGIVRGSLDRLVAALGARGVGVEPLHALSSFVVPRVSELEQALAAARHKPMNAKNRLGLERLVGRVSRELDAARELLDVLEEASWGPPVRLNLLECVRESFEAGDTAEADTTLLRSATLRAAPRAIEVYVKPRLAVGLIQTAIGLIAPDVGHEVHITLDVDGAVGVHRGTGEGDRVTALARRVIEPTLVCIEAAAGLSGVNITGDGERLLDLRWPLVEEPVRRPT
jgi:hypothetical protein